MRLACVSIITSYSEPMILLPGSDGRWPAVVEKLSCLNKYKFYAVSGNFTQWGGVLSQ